MAANIKTLSDASGNQILPRTRAKAVTMDDGSNLEDKIIAVVAEAHEYADEKLADIPTPDVSGQIGAHNTNTSAHSDIRTAVSNAAAAAAAAQSTANSKEASGTAASAVSSHNSSTSAHSDIRTAVSNAESNAKAYTDQKVAAISFLHIGTSAPSNTNLLWIDTANSNLLKFYNGSAWTAICAVWAE